MSLKKKKTILLAGRGAEQKGVDSKRRKRNRS